MSQVFVCGLGAVSSAGWGIPALRAAVEKNEPPSPTAHARPGWDKPLWFRAVPAPAMRPGYLTHPRLRRASAIAQYTVAAGLEAVGEDASRVQAGALRLSIIVCVMAGSVSYSRRLYEEILKDPATASPLIFPETVFNAPASHLAAYLNTNAACYTLVGDDGTFLQGLALAAEWLSEDGSDGCLVIGAEETDWTISDAMRLFQRQAVHSGGAGALYLQRHQPPPPAVEIAGITDAFTFTRSQRREEAAQRMRAQLPGGAPNELLCLGIQGLPRADAAETAAWQDWAGARRMPKAILGEAFAASAALQCVVACDALRRGEFAAANVSVVGANQQAIGARFATLHASSGL